MVRSLINFSLSCKDIIIIKIKDARTKKKMFFKKKNMFLYSFFQQLHMMSMQKKKTNQAKIEM